MKFICFPSSILPKIPGAKFDFNVQNLLNVNVLTNIDFSILKPNHAFISLKICIGKLNFYCQIE